MRLLIGFSKKEKKGMNSYHPIAYKLIKIIVDVRQYRLQRSIASSNVLFFQNRNRCVESCATIIIAEST